MAVASAWACMAVAWAFEVYIEVVAVAALGLEQELERVYIEGDLVQELVLGMAVELEQGMAEEQVQVCIEEVLVQELVQDTVEEHKLDELELKAVERECI